MFIVRDISLFALGSKHRVHYKQYVRLELDLNYCLFYRENEMLPVASIFSL